MFNGSQLVARTPSDEETGMDELIVDVRNGATWIKDCLLASALSHGAWTNGWLTCGQGEKRAEQILVHRIPRALAWVDG